MIFEHLTEELHLVLLGRIEGEGGHLTTDSVVKRGHLHFEAGESETKKTAERGLETMDSVVEAQRCSSSTNCR